MKEIDYIYFILLIFFVISRSSSEGINICFNKRNLLLNAEVYLTIKGPSNERILNNNTITIYNPNINRQEYFRFEFEPSEIIINGEVVSIAESYIYNLTNEINNVTIKFDRDITSCSVMFNGLKNIIKIDLSNFDTSKVTEMKAMFRECTSLETVDLTNFDTSSVIDFSCMFYNCKKLTSLDLSSFRTSSVIYMNEMFDGCNIIKSLYLSHFDTSNVKYMNNMFKDCNEIISLDISGFNTSSVIKMDSMFKSCFKLTSLEIHNFNTKLVNNMAYMFYNCYLVESLNLTNFDTSKVTQINGMFYSCRSLTSLDLGSFDTSSCINIGHMFFDCNKLVTLNISNFLLTRAMYADSLFRGCTSLEYLDITNLNTSNIVKMDNLFRDCQKLVSLDLSNFDTSKATSLANMFYGCNSIVRLNLNNFNTSLTQNMEGMFYGCSSLESLFLSNFNTSLVTKMNNMFYGCSSLVSLDLTNFDTSSVTNFENMFTNSNNNLIYCINQNENENKNENFLSFISNLDNSVNFVNNCSYFYPDESIEHTNIEEDTEEDIKEDEPLDFENFKLINKEEGVTINGYSSENNIEDLIKMYPNLTIVDLGDCANKLKTAYSLPSYTKFFIIVTDNSNLNANSSINKFDYEVYLYNGTRIEDLSICNDVPIIVWSSINDVESVKLNKGLEFNDIGYDIYNKTDIFYTDYCAPASDNGNDITLEDRKKYYYPNISICNEGCEYKNVDYENQRFICDCYINKNNTEEENIIDDESYLDYFLSLINYKIILCFDLFFNFTSFYYNSGFYISFSVLLILLILMIFFWIKGLKKLRLIFYRNTPIPTNLIQITKCEKKQKKIKKVKFNNKMDSVEKIIVTKNNDESIRKRVRISSQKLIIHNNLQNKIKLNLDQNENRPKKKYKTSHKKSTKSIQKFNNPIINLQNENNGYTEKTTNTFLKLNTMKKEDYKKEKDPYYNINKDNKENLNNIYNNTEIYKDTELIIDFNFEKYINKNDDEIDFKEINDIPYRQALRIDKRTIVQTFISVIKNKIDILNLFYYKKNFSYFSLDISIYLFELLLDLTLNCFLYTDDVVSEKYNNNGEISMLTSLSLSLISNIVSAIVVYIIVKLVNYVELLEIILKNVKNKKIYYYNIIRYFIYIKIRLSFYFFFELSLSLMMTYYLFIFCSVYHQSQGNIMVNYITGACISLATSFGLTLIITICRNLSLKYKSVYFFNISKYLYDCF